MKQVYVIHGYIENRKSFLELFNQVPCVIAALDDHIIPHQYSDILAKDLQADYIRLQQGGHFLAREGWLEFPLVLEKIKSYFKHE